MADTEIIRLLHQLKLKGMVEAYERQEARGNLQMSFNKRLLILLNAEIDNKRNMKALRLLKQAKLKEKADVNHIHYSAERGLDREMMEELCDLSWIGYHRNLCLTGATGTGKTWLACALGHEACLNGIPVLFKKVSLLLEELVAAQAAGNKNALLVQFAKYPLMILDDWMLDIYSTAEQNLLFELIESRERTHSTIITSLMPIRHWHEVLENQSLADSLVDRLVNSAQHIELRGPSLRRMNWRDD